MDKKSLTEADIRSKYIDPAIIKKGWTEDMIRREYYFTDGRVIFDGYKWRTAFDDAGHQEGFLRESRSEGYQSRASCR